MCCRGYSGHSLLTTVSSSRGRSCPRRQEKASFLEIGGAGRLVEEHWPIIINKVQPVRLLGKIDHDWTVLKYVFLISFLQYQSVSPISAHPVNALNIDKCNLAHLTLHSSRSFWPLSHFHVRSGHRPMTSYINQKCCDFAAMSRPRPLNVKLT